MTEYVIAIDQGTSSSRAIIFDRAGEVVSAAHKEHEQVMPRAGWVEHDPKEIWDNVLEVISCALEAAKLSRDDIAAIGVTNQRETVVVWDRNTGVPVYNAIVWQDTRTQAIVDRLALRGGTGRFQKIVGVPLASYFSGAKISWMLENVAGVRESAHAGELLCGTIDSWVVWNLTGGQNGGIHITDVTNASRTMFMDLETLSWREDILEVFDVPVSMLPRIRSSSEVYGVAACSTPVHGVPVSGILGDQQAATFGHAAFEAGESKNTYGTGSFLMFQTGTQIVHSRSGLLTTVGYKLGDQPAHYALEGSVAVTGSVVQWLRDQLGVIGCAAEVEELACSVQDNGGVYFVPAFSGLFAPYWRADARGAIVGLTRHSNKAHIARAALESVAFQCSDVIDAMYEDTGVHLSELRVDGGMVANRTLMQFQADVLGVPVVCSGLADTTALGAAYVAGLAVGFWSDLDQLRGNRREGERFHPRLSQSLRDQAVGVWRKAVTKSMGWVEQT